MNAHQLIDYLPPLRRHARSLFGDQDAGDALILAAIQSITHDFDDLDEVDQMELYRRIADLWTGDVGDRIRQLSNKPTETQAYDRCIKKLPPMARQAFLLRTVEDISIVSIADIMDLEVAEVDELLRSARQIVTDHLSTDVLIIEDEFFIATTLEDIVTSLGHNVVGIERTHAGAIAAIEKNRPGLILADVHLADGSSGLHAVQDILKQAVEIPVIFITAYPDRLLTRPTPTFVIAKPFTPEAVGETITEALFFDIKAKWSECGGH